VELKVDDDDEVDVKLYDGIVMKIYALHYESFHVSLNLEAV
jgi:hypothetical protein